MLFNTHKKSRMRRLMSSYLDGEIDGEREYRLLSHVETCRWCRDEMAAQKELRALLGGAMRKVEIPDIRRDVLSALDRQKEARSGVLSRLFAPSLRPALAYAAAAAFGIAVGVLVWNTVAPVTTTAASDPLPVTYLSEKPPYSLVTLYFGSTSEEVNE
jgi:anti-sigma factor RsiW